MVCPAVLHLMYYTWNNMASTVPRVAVIRSWGSGDAVNHVSEGQVLYSHHLTPTDGRRFLYHRYCCCFMKAQVSRHEERDPSSVQLCFFQSKPDFVERIFSPSFCPFLVLSLTSGYIIAEPCMGHCWAKVQDKVVEMEAERGICSLQIFANCSGRICITVSLKDVIMPWSKFRPLSGILSFLKCARPHTALSCLSRPWACVLFSGADVHFKTPLGRTALHVAAIKGHYDCIDELLIYGAQAATPDNEGQTAMSLARLWGQKQSERKMFSFFWKQRSSGGGPSIPSST